MTDYNNKEPQEERIKSYSTKIMCAHCDRPLGEIMTEDKDGMRSIINLLNKTETYGICHACYTLRGLDKVPEDII